MTEQTPRQTSMPDFAAIVFDMDGTLFDSSTVVPAAYQLTMAEAGGPSLTRDEIIERYVLGPPPRIMRNLLGQDASEMRITGAVRSYHAHLAELARTLQPYPGIRTTLAALAPECQLGVFTGADTVSAELLLAGAGLLHMFAVARGTDPSDRAKPAPDGLIATCTALGVRPQQVAYIGDSPLDQQCARAAGAFAVRAGWGHLVDDSEPCDLVADAPADLVNLIAESPLPSH